MNSPTPDLSDNIRCPGCGAPNECAIAAGRPAADCWCMAAPRGLAVPSEAVVGAASCWCPACLQQQAERALNTAH